MFATTKTTITLIPLFFIFFSYTNIVYIFPIWFFHLNIPCSIKLFSMKIFSKIFNKKYAQMQIRFTQ